MISLLPGPADGLDQIRLSDLLPAAEVTRSDLCVDLDTRVGRDEMLGDIVSTEDGDTRVDDGVVFPVYLGDSEYVSGCFFKEKRHMKES